MLISDKIVLAQSLRESGVAKQLTSSPLDAHLKRAVYRTYLTATGSYRIFTCFPAHRNLYHFMIYLFIFQTLIRAVLSNRNYLVHVEMYILNNP